MKLTRNAPTFDFGHIADFDQWLRHPFAGFPAVGQFLGEFLPNAGNRLSADVYEDHNSYFAKFELPGIRKEDLKVEVHDKILTVSADRLEKRGDKQEVITLSRSVSVPEDVRSDAIGAKLEDGILTVTLPKQEKRQPKLIAVS